MTIQPVTTEAQWQSVKAIRTDVFIDEQECPPEEEWDGHDARSRHLLATVDDTPVGTARWRSVPYNEAVVAKLERFAVRKPYRGQGHGTDLVRATLADARQAGFHTFVLHAQAHLEDWYARFEFRSTGRRFEEVGIPHVEMVRRDTVSPTASA